VPEIDPYAVLGVPRSATREEIARAYRTLAKRLHPDAGPDTASVAMSRVNEAWRILSDPVRRRGWDARHAMATAPHWRTVPASAGTGSTDIPRRPSRASLPRTRRDSGWLAVAVLAVCALLVATVMVFINAAVGPAAIDDGERFASSEITFVHPPSWTVLPGTPDQPADHRVIAHISSYGIEPGDACTDITLDCTLDAATVPPGEAAIIVTAWSEGEPPVADPVRQLPAGPGSDATIGGEPAAFRWQSSDDGATAWWQLSSPGFPDRWIEVMARIGGRPLEQRDALDEITEVLRTLQFTSPAGS
jgi:hypothetical protein